MKKKPIDIASLNKDIILGVGYKNPPKHSQFPKGQSGNPKGRPARNAVAPDSSYIELGRNAAITSRVLSKPVKVWENGKSRQISKAEAIQLSLEKNAMLGRTLAIRDVNVRRQINWDFVRPD